MATTTITADVGDQKPGVGLPAMSVAGGGSAGSRGVTLIIDWSKVTATGGLRDLVGTIERMAEHVREMGVNLPTA